AWRDVIQPVHVRIELRVGAVLGNLLHSAMQIPDDALCPQDLFAIQLEDYAQHPVGGGMLRAHIEDYFRGIQKRLIRHTLGHWPLSMFRFSCTHRSSCWMIP